MPANKKANIFLSISDQQNKTGEEAVTNEIVELGTLTESELVGYAYKLTSQHKLPADSCLTEMAITERKNRQIKLTKEANYAEPEESCYNELDLCIVPKMTKQECLASNAQQCMRFILGGKCRDKFIIDNVISKFCLQGNAK